MTCSNLNKDATHFVRQRTFPGAGLCSAGRAFSQFALRGCMSLLRSWNQVRSSSSFLGVKKFAQDLTAVER